jgi:RNA polymerase sigma-70 factor (ECF subfamily)
MERAEEALGLAAALERLPQPRREIIHAHLFEGLPYAEISRRLGKSEGALRILFKRAIDQLREILESEA